MCNANTLSYSILVDNEAHSPGMITEHGLSIWIDTGKTKILFDTGQSDAFLSNAKKLGIDISMADHLVLSHGHYDHSGGFAALEGILPETTPIHAHPGIFIERFSRHSDGSLHEIGLPDSARDFLRKRKEYFHPIEEPAEIAPDVWLTGFVPRETQFEDTGGDFWLDHKCTRPDLIHDDMALWVERPEGLWVFLGCTHSGTINTITHIQSVSGKKDVHAIIGGTHLRSASEERLEKTVDFFQELAPEILIPCHCSGTRIHEIMQSNSSNLSKGDL